MKFKVIASILWAIATSSSAWSQTGPDTPLSEFGAGSTITLQFPLEFTDSNSGTILWFQEHQWLGRSRNRPGNLAHGPRCEFTRLDDSSGTIPANTRLRVIRSERPFQRSSNYWELAFVTPEGVRVNMTCLGDHDWLGLYFPPTLADLVRSLPISGFSYERVAPIPRPESPSLIQSAGIWIESILSDLPSGAEISREMEQQWSGLAN